MTEKLRKSDDEWREQLTAEQFRVAREGGTEPAFTGKYYQSKDAGTYLCVCCGQQLFDSQAKYDSGSGWPSFDAPVDEQSVDRHSDDSHGMVRTEIRCSRCDAHLGHVFPDGPDSTSERYCINSASLDLRENP